MNFDWTPEQAAFQQRVRTFLADNLPKELTDQLQEGEAIQDEIWDENVKRFDAGMVKNGWQVQGMPPEYGIKNLSAMERLILLSEVDYANAPRFMRATAVSVVPTLAAMGSEENKAMWLEKLMTGEVTLSIGYSEPSAGSDLAALRTKAVLDGDHWVINGQKTWNSRGHIVSHIWLLARTGTPESRHKGLSMFIVPMNAPGVEVQKVPSWGDHMFNDVFFSDVRVPKSHLIGQEGQGWSIVMNAVGGERAFVGFAYSLRAILDDLIEYCKTTSFEGQVLAERPEVRLGLAKLEVELELSHLLGLDIASRVDAGEATDAEALGLKIYSSEMRSRMSDFAMQTLGLPGLLDRHNANAPMKGDIEVLFRRSPITRIGVGANEVLRDVVAQRGLGLPRGK
jgi:alkylation response protein AidB-like acyl-CoA dehydrogenase